MTKIYIGSLILKFEIEEPLLGQQCITWYSNIGSISLTESSGGAYVQEDTSRGAVVIHFKIQF